MDDLPWCSVLEMAERLRARTLSSVELTTALLSHIDRYEPGLNAFIEIDRDRALGAAEACDRESAAGSWRGPLHGIPYAAKDIFDVAGKPTTCHSRIMPTRPAAVDAAAVARLNVAGGVLVGKTSLHEFATGGPSFDLPWPPARNPWNPSVHPGGSSSGSAVAVAAGFVPLALGTDTAGSVRHPASVCGIVGMKATFGASSLAGCFPLSFSLDHVGSLTRSVQDNALALASLLEPEARRRTGCRPGLQPFGALDQGLNGLRVGVIEAFHRGADVNPEIAAATDAAVQLIAAQGASVRRLELPALNVFTECGRTILQAEAFAVHAAWLRERPQDYGTRGRRRLLVGALIPAERYVKAQQVRECLAQQYAAAMQDLHVAVCASSLELPCAIDDEALVERTYDKQARTPFNVLGVPAISVPISLSQRGLPIGIQIAAKAWDEALVYRAAFGLERAVQLAVRPALA